MKLWETFLADLMSVAFTLLGAAIFYLVRARARLIWGGLHEFAFRVPGPITPN